MSLLRGSILAQANTARRQRVCISSPEIACKLIEGPISRLSSHIYIYTHIYIYIYIYIDVCIYLVFIFT